VTDAFGGYGGIAQYNRDLLGALSNSEFVERVLVLPRRTNKATGCLPPKILQLPPIHSPIAYSLNAFAAAGRAGPFDVVFCGHIHHAPLAEALRRVLGVKVWLQTHGLEAWDAPSRIIRFAVEPASLVTAVSRYTRRRILDWSRIDPDRVRVLPNTFRPMFAPGPRSEEIREKFGLTGKKLILTVSRISRADDYKGHVRVIDSMSKVRESEPRAVYVVVGDGDARCEFETLTTQRGMTESVRFLGQLGDQDLLSLYRSADVFVMPSTREGFGIVFVEAAAAGLPVIAGNRDGSVDALADGALGRLIDPLSQDQLTTALIDMLNEPPPPSVVAAQRFSRGHFANHVNALVQNLAD
jgi:phosphatidylinositol alpha-1,6-mannosyltransferase